MTRNELDHAIQASFDGTLADAECLRLRAVLKSDPAARALYYEYADLHQSLVFRISRFTTFDSARSLADIRLHIQSRRSARLAITAAAAALIILGVVLKLTLVPAPALATYRQAHGSLYTIEHSSGKDRSPGELDKQSIVNLSQGTFEFTLRNGNRGVVLAPAQFELRTENELLLREGTAWFEVSEKGKGFRVITKDLVVTDLGTEFGVLAGKESAHEVHVFSGRVRASAAQGAAEMLTAGHARRSGSDGRLEAIPVKPGDFLTRLPEAPRSGLIVNGNFESGSSPADDNFGVKASAALLPGWSFGRDVTVAHRSANGALGLGSGGSNLVSPTKDVQISFNNTASNYEVGTLDDSIWQTFTTVPQQEYEVRFEMGGYFVARGQGDVSVTATVYDGLATSGQALGQISDRRAGNGNRDNGYNPPVAFTFTARSSSTTLVLTETSPNSDKAAPAIDNVIVRALPEKLPPGDPPPRK
jgi:ferric-dicitrate binding protein FerR (iron transport regulator)